MQVIARLPHVGLNADPITTKATTTFTGEVIKLPYMGANSLDDVAARPYPTEELKLKSYQEKEAGSEAQKPPEYTDPCELLIQKVERLSQILGCSEAEAQHILFTHL